MIDTIFALITYFRQRGIELVCCGGAARDTLHNREVKDLGFIIIANDELCTPSISEIEAHLSKLHGATDVNPIAGYQEGVESRLDWVVKFEYNGFGIDLIKPVANCLDPLSALDTLDMNINQAYFDFRAGTARILTADDYPSIWYNIPVVLKAADVSRERVQYIQDKFPEYQYLINESRLKE